MKLFVVIILSLIIGTLIGIVCMYNIMEDKLYEKRMVCRKYKMMYKMMERWMYCYGKKRYISAYLEKNNMRRIAIYGCGDIGKLLYSQLDASKIIVVYGIDRNASLKFPTIIKPIDEIDDSIDAVIVTSIAYYYEIEENLKKKVKCPVLSLEDIIYEIAY